VELARLDAIKRGREGDLCDDLLITVPPQHSSFTDLQTFLMIRWWSTHS